VIHVQRFENKQHVNIFLPSTANLKCTPSDRQMYPQGYMYPRLGNPGLVDAWNREQFSDLIILKFWPVEKRDGTSKNANCL